MELGLLKNVLQGAFFVPTLGNASFAAHKNQNFNEKITKYIYDIFEKYLFSLF